MNNVGFPLRFLAFLTACALAAPPSAYALRQTGLEESDQIKSELITALLGTPPATLPANQNRVSPATGLEESERRFRLPLGTSVRIRLGSKSNRGEIRLGIQDSGEEVEMVLTSEDRRTILVPVGQIRALQATASEKIANWLREKLRVLSKPNRVPFTQVGSVGETYALIPKKKAEDLLLSPTLRTGLSAGDIQALVEAVVTYEYSWRGKERGINFAVGTGEFRSAKGFSILLDNAAISSRYQPLSPRNTHFIDISHTGLEEGRFGLPLGASIVLEMGKSRIEFVWTLAQDGRSVNLNLSNLEEDPVLWIPAEELLGVPMRFQGGFAEWLDSRIRLMSASRNLTVENVQKGHQIFLLPMERAQALLENPHLDTNLVRQHSVVLTYERRWQGTLWEYAEKGINFSIRPPLGPPMEWKFDQKPAFRVMNNDAAGERILMGRLPYIRLSKHAKVTVPMGGLEEWSAQMERVDWVLAEVWEGLREAVAEGDDLTMAEILLKVYVTGREKLGSSGDPNMVLEWDKGWNDLAEILTGEEGIMSGQNRNVLQGTRRLLAGLISQMTDSSWDEKGLERLISAQGMVGRSIPSRSGDYQFVAAAVQWRFSRGGLNGTTSDQLADRYVRLFEVSPKEPVPAVVPFQVLPSRRGPPRPKYLDQPTRVAAGLEESILGDRIEVPLADISSQTIVHVQEGAVSGRVLDALRAAGVQVVPFELDNVPPGQPDQENVYLMDVQLGSEREWVLDSSAIVINLRSDNPASRPDSPEELGALINVAREVEGRILRVGAIHRSDLQNNIIAIDTQL